MEKSKRGRPSGTQSVRPAAMAIQKRFFEVLDMLIAQGKIGGLEPFCNQYGLYRPKYSNLRTSLKDPDRKKPYRVIDIDAPIYLIKDYGVSVDWLYFGRGPMFKSQKEPVRQLLNCD